MLATDSALPLSQDHISAIGRVTAYFSLLENHANTLISDLLELKTREDVISLTAHMNFSGKIQIIKTLSSTKLESTPELKAQLQDAVSDMERSNQGRNNIAHANWYYYSPSTNESGLLKQSARGSIKTSLEGYTPEKINEIAVLIFSTTGKIQQFLMAKNGAIHFG